MTAYLIDENVLREFGTRGNANVRKWLATVDDAGLRLSVVTLFEKRRGAEASRAREGGGLAQGHRGDGKDLC